MLSHGRKHCKKIREDSPEFRPSLRQFANFLSQKVKNEEIALGTSKELAEKEVTDPTVLAAQGTSSTKKKKKSNNKKRKYSCRVCQSKEHTSFKCPTLTEANLAKRKKEADKLKLCYKCLYPDHNSSDCTATWAKPCSKCQGDHHVLFCEQ